MRSTAELATWWVTEWACARTSIRRGPRFARAYKNERRLVKEGRAYRDGIKRKGDKIGMVSVVSSKMRMVSEEL